MCMNFAKKKKKSVLARLTGQTQAYYITFSILPFL
jgi:hypothetical protein